MPGIEDLHMVKHAHGIFLYEVRKKKVYNIQLSQFNHEKFEKNQKELKQAQQKKVKPNIFYPIRGSKKRKFEPSGSDDEEEEEDSAPVGETPIISNYDTISDGWSFSEFAYIHYDNLTKSYALLVLEGRAPAFKINKYDMTDVINAFKLMRLEESERKR